MSSMRSSQKLVIPPWSDLPRECPESRDDQRRRSRQQPLILMELISVMFLKLDIE